MTKKPWKPREGKEYWYVSPGLYPVVTENDDMLFDTRVICSGNCFKTKEEAEEAAEKIKQLLKEIKK